LQSDLDSLRISLNNAELDELYQQTKDYLVDWAFKPSILNSAGLLIDTIVNITETESWQTKVDGEIRDMIDSVFAENGTGFHEFTLLAGNVDEADIQAIQQARLNASLSPSIPYIPPVHDIFRPSFSTNGEQPIFLYQNMENIPVGRSAVRLVVPIGNILDPTSAAFSYFINAVCAGQFFAALRTREQLGYAVGSVRNAICGQMHMAFVVQTEKLNATETLGRIENWVQNWIVDGVGEKDEYLEIDGDEDTTMPFAEQFEKVKDGVVKEAESKYASLEAKTDVQETLLTESRDNLLLHAQILDAIRGMTREQFRDLVKLHFGARETWRAVVLEAGEERTVSREGWDVVKYDDL
jgi:secreted Zn-dependent insulinase-like peptidase